MCTFCRKVPETIKHLLCDCDEIQSLWEDFGRYILEEYNVKVNLQPQNILFNRVEKNQNSVVNFLCLIVKQYIYRQKCQSKWMHFQEVQGSFRKLESIEKYIAQKNNRLSKHALKWKKDEICV